MRSVEYAALSISGNVFMLWRGNYCISVIVIIGEFAEENILVNSCVRSMSSYIILPLCTYRLNWARRTSRGRWDEWNYTALQTQNLKFEPWRAEAEHASSRSRRLPTILNLYEWAGKKHLVSLKLEGQSGVRTRDLRFSKQAT